MISFPSDEMPITPKRQPSRDGDSHHAPETAITWRSTIAPARSRHRQTAIPSAIDGPISQPQPSPAALALALALAVAVTV
jgi:hypothetical protein